MTAKEAAKFIGCSASLVRHLIRTDQMRASKVNLPGGGFSYDITSAEARRVKSVENHIGWKRGRKRRVLDSNNNTV